jgi:hypothetical protein
MCSYVRGCTEYRPLQARSVPRKRDRRHPMCYRYFRLMWRSLVVVGTMNANGTGLGKLTSGTDADWRPCY